MPEDFQEQVLHQGACVALFHGHAEESGRSCCVRGHQQRLRVRGRHGDGLRGGGPTGNQGRGRGVRRPGRRPAHRPRTASPGLPDLGPEMVSATIMEIASFLSAVTRDIISNEVLADLCELSEQTGIFLENIDTQIGKIT